MKIKSNMASKLQRTGVISVVWHLGYLASQSSLRQEKNGISIGPKPLFGIHSEDYAIWWSTGSPSFHGTVRIQIRNSKVDGGNFPPLRIPPRHCNYWDTYSSGHPLLLTVLKGADLATCYRSYYPWGSGLRYRMSFIPFITFTKP